MKNKKAFELSINMIIIVILAFAMLGVGMYIINQLRFDIPELPQACDINPPKSDAPICIESEIEIGRGKQVKLPIAFYNDENEDLTGEILPEITCSPNIDGGELELKTTAAGTSIPITEVGQYMIVVKVPKTSDRGTYPCILKISETEQTFTFTVT
ncbi:hypothetical protein HOC35_02930 [Candidatus Woesearchaeota archaeon]|jgi:hypothetical protein|nr:hypothetical protein [Candidatus Woesearchaeota archaeon]